MQISHCDSCWSFDIRLSESMMARDTRDFSLFVDDSGEILETFSNVTRLGFEIENASGLALALEGGVEHIFYTNLFKDRINKYFFSGLARLNYHFFSADRRLDFYPSVGALATYNDQFDESDWQAIFALGWAWHFRPHAVFLFTEPGFSSNFSDTHIWHFTVGIGFEY